MTTTNIFIQTYRPTINFYNTYAYNDTIHAHDKFFPPVLLISLDINTSNNIVHTNTISLVKNLPNIPTRSIVKLEKRAQKFSIHPFP